MLQHLNIIERRYTTTEDQFLEPLDEETRDGLMYSALDDSTKLIAYLEEVAKKQRKYNIAILVFTIISALCGIISVFIAFFD